MIGTVRGGSVLRLKPTGPFEEHPKVGRTVAELAARAERGGASAILFLPQRGVRFDAFAFAYHTGLAKEMNIPKPPDGPLRGTIVINVSGHASGGLTDKATAWAEGELGAAWPVGDDARRFQLLRGAAEKAIGELLRDRARPRALVEVGAAKVELTRARLEKLQRATADSMDTQLSQLAHAGNIALRKHFAATNTYDVRMRLPDGTITEMTQLQRNNPARIELATRLQVELPRITGTIVLEAYPTGSAGVGGYVEARRYHIHLGADLFSLEGAQAAAEQYERSHPEIRWSTDFEDDDLEAHHVPPSPRPYQDF